MTNAFIEAHPDADEIELKLLQAAVKVFLRDGYRATRMQDIAREAGLSTGAIYNRFRGKHEIFSALLTTPPQNAVSERLKQAKAKGELPETVAEFGDFVVDGWPRISDALMVEALVGARGDRDAREAGEQRLRETRDIDRKILLEARKAGLLDNTTDIDRLAEVLALFRLGSAVAQLGGDNFDLDPRRILSTLIETLSPSVKEAPKRRASRQPSKG